MKIFYVNDETKPITIQIIHQMTLSPHHPHGEPNIEYIVLQPTESKSIEIDAPKGAIPYVKRWDNRVLLTYLPLEAQVPIPSTSDR